MSDQHDHSAPPSDPELRAKALETLLVEKGLVNPQTLNTLIDTYENKVGPRNGAMVVAKAWCDSNYLDWLRSNATDAINSLGFSGRQGEHMKIVENTDSIHNLVVCTLCSCYPWTVLGLPPVWYKSAPYRARAVSDPRGILAEFGATVAEKTDIRVWDSTAEMRYLVIPQRPAGTENFNQTELASLVTRNSMIGVERDLQITGNKT